MNRNAHAKEMLFGLLALQNHFVTRDGLVAAFNTWLGDTSRSLAGVMVEQGALVSGHRQLLQALVEAHLARHSGDVQLSIQAVARGDGVVNASLPALAAAVEVDHDLNRCLLAASELPRSDSDPDATVLKEAGAAEDGWGRYRVLRKHKRGGLGQIYLARDSELGRLIALKEILSENANREDLKRRFVLEAEITGNLEHPGVVPVYGLGQYPDGRYYYAMRFIDGQSLAEASDEFHRRWGETLKPADGRLGETQPDHTPDIATNPTHEEAKTNGRGASRRLALRELLQKFVSVCDALAYAHSRGVLHRDLKPANIMLGRYGETLVVDWGLAKATGKGNFSESSQELPGEQALVPPSGSDPGATLAGSALGTPQYMSPEQARGELDTLGPATDIYGLGAVLYYILTGRPPVDGETKPEVLANVELGRIRPPSERGKQVSRALEAVCLKALAFRPEARYATATDLADEVRRWLADEPVAARRESWSERAGRWMRRNQSSMAAAASVLVTAVLGLGLATLLVSFEQIQTERARDRALVEKRAADEARNAAVTARNDAVRLGRLEAEQRTKADKEAEIARRTADFLIEMFRASDPLAIAGLSKLAGNESTAELTARQILDRGAEQIRTGLSEQPRVRAALMTTIGSVYRSMGLYELAEPLLKDAVAIYGKVGGRDLELAEAEYQLGWYYHDLADYGNAEPLYRDALAIRSEIAPESLACTYSKLNVAWLMADQQLPEAEPLLREIVADFARRPGQSRAKAVAQLGLVAFLLDHNRELESLPILLQASTILAVEPGFKKATQALIDFQQGVGFDAQGLYFLAEPKLHSALKHATELLGDSHPYRAFILYELGDTLEHRGNRAGALKAYRECFELMRRSRQGLTHPRVMFLVINYAKLLCSENRRDEAERICDEFVQERRRRLGNHWLVADAMVAKARSLYDNGNERQLQLYTEAIDLYEHTTTERPTNLRLQMALNEYGYCLLKANNPAKAEPVFRRLDQIMHEVKNTDENRALMLENYGDCLIKLGKIDEARDRLRESIERYNLLPQPTRGDSVYPLSELQKLELNAGRPRATLTVAGELLDSATKYRPTDMRKRESAHDYLGMANEELGLFSDARLHFDQSLIYQQDRSETNRGDWAWSFYNLILVAWLEQRHDICEYRRHELLARHSGSDGETVVRATLMCLALGPELGRDRHAALALADYAVEKWPKSKQMKLWHAFVLLNAGDAVAALSAIDSIKSEDWQYRAHLEVLRALAHAQMGDNARATSEAEAARSQLRSALNAKKNGVYLQNWSFRAMGRAMLKRLERAGL